MISQQEFFARRQRLLAQCEPNSVCLIPAATLVTRSRDTEYTFRQNSDFWYLTGFNEPDTWLLLSNHERHGGSFVAMVCQPKDKNSEIWHGRRLGAEDALGRFDLDEAYELDELPEVLMHWLMGHTHVYFGQGQNTAADALVNAAMQSLRTAPKEYSAPKAMVDIQPTLHEMRLFKSASEVAVMKAACQISASAHRRAMQFARAGVFEYQLEAELHHEFAMAGARSPAYSTIVGSGDNACILHYTENTKALAEHELVLIDAGAEFMGYAADITRTFPVSGTFSKPQKDIYNLVLKAQQKALDMLAPGVTLRSVTERVIETLTEGLVALKLLPGTVAQNLETEGWRQFFMHGLGHFIGLDVHDVGDYRMDGEDRPLQPGMVLTVEPGLYIAPDAPVDEQYQGIGVRIEDNVVVTATGIDILTNDVPKTVPEIEALLQR
ncbi:Xaa-Pro aminopeptidase [Alteromonas lipotrueiana]|uniref:Xaa-Pro aminopeptidase n=1 Tax=Alteromonas lipotrueiana TaxID=2803815 RepID=UPI001C46B469|nr:Xaa-Pro aminopeptidase [Alteromonas lipotrueiana]